MKIKTCSRLRLLRCFAFACLPALGGLASTHAAELPAKAADELARQFLAPPTDAKAGVWWRWIDGNVSKEGITRDLSEMARQGITVLDLFDVGGAPKVGTATMMGPEWRALFQHALAEAAKLGISINVVPAAGWGIGGPWIDATHATKTLTYREIQVDGPQRLTCDLPAASGPGGYYRDAMVVAFPAPATSPLRPLKVRASSVQQGYCREENFPAVEGVDGDPETVWHAAPKATFPVTLDLSYPQPLPAVRAFIASPSGAGPATGEIQASDDGKTFRTVTTLALQPGESRVVPFPPVTAGHFRLLVATAHDPQIRLAEFQVLRTGDQPQSRPGTKWWKFKSANRSVWNWPKMRINLLLADEYSAPDVTDCRSTDTVDLTAKMSPDGKLTWDVPAGRWTIARFGVVLVGEPPRAKSRAVPGGGYEVDPYSPAAADALYDATAKILVADTPPASRKAFTGLFTDSYEIGASADGQQGTWTEGFRETFRKKHGYDLLPWLPALTRRVVDDRQSTNRFLWDYRQVLADLYNDFYARWTQRAHADGLLMRAENVYGTYPQPHIDGLAAGGRVDVPMGEFWFDGLMTAFYPTVDSVRTAASAAHLYDKPLVGAESLTIAKAFEQSPKDWKRMLDGEFCKGLNQVMIHLWSQQYDVTARPGLHTYDAINANITWWPHADGFLDYIARCQQVLRFGQPFADLCYFILEDSCAYVPGRQQMTPAIPDGYEYDGLNAEVLLSRVTAKDGRVTLPHGISYRYLVLPDHAGWRVTAPVIERLAALVRDGITVIGPKPSSSPGLGDAEAQDRRIRRCADELWGAEAAASGNRKIGQGRVIWGRELKEILTDDGVPPDFGVGAESPVQNVAFAHRADADTDFYFVSNQGAKAGSFDATFRVTGRQPEFWDPLTGTRREVPRFTTNATGTTVPLTLEAGGSLIVVFTPVSRKADAQQSKPEVKVSENKPVLELTGPWTVQFDPAWLYPLDGLTGDAAKGLLTLPTLTPWSERPEPAFRHYSGIAVYRTEFTWTPTTTGPLWLELGTVHETARVRLNGKDLGVVWCAPWRIEVTDTLKAGVNQVEIEVANLWVNRLRGDSLLPAEQRRTRTNRDNYYKPGDKPPVPRSSGLLGPVTLQTAGMITIESTDVTK